MLFDARVQLLGAVVFTILLNFLVLGFLCWFELVAFLFDDLVNCFVDELISAMALSILCILDHEILKLVDMSRCLENVTECHAGACELKHIFLEDEVFAPLSFKICFEG